MNEFCDIQKLTELFNPKQGDSDSEDENERSTGARSLNPSNFSGPKAPNSTKINPYSKIENDESKRREILDPDEEDDYLFDKGSNPKADWKETPKWDVTYRQQVTSSDVFLQMGFKNPTTASCEDMIVAIHMPGDNHQHMDLKILKDRLTLVSPRFYLDLPLPQPVDPQRGNAKWDKEGEKLLVTLKMDRELDVVNF